VVEAFRRENLKEFLWHRSTPVRDDGPSGNAHLALTTLLSRTFLQKIVSARRRNQHARRARYPKVYIRRLDGGHRAASLAAML
jgi:hypothetical protein